MPTKHLKCLYCTLRATEEITMEEKGKRNNGRNGKKFWKAMLRAAADCVRQLKIRKHKSENDERKYIDQLKINLSWNPLGKQTVSRSQILHCVLKHVSGLFGAFFFFSSVILANSNDISFLTLMDFFSTYTKEKNVLLNHLWESNSFLHTKVQFVNFAKIYF